MAKMIVVNKKSIINSSQPAAGAEKFLLGCPYATFGPFAPKPYICNVWHHTRHPLELIQINRPPRLKDPKLGRSGTSTV